MTRARESSVRGCRQFILPRPPFAFDQLSFLYQLVDNEREIRPLPQPESVPVDRYPVTRFVQDGYRFVPRMPPRVLFDEGGDSFPVSGREFRRPVAHIASRTHYPLAFGRFVGRPFFAEGTEQHLPAALSAFRKGDEHLRAFTLPVRQPFDAFFVGGTPQKDRLGHRSVASAPSRFLDVRFRRRRGVPVDHRTDILFVHAHAPGAGAHEDRPLVSVEPGLDLELFVLLEARVVKADVAVAEGFAEEPGGSFGAAPGGAEDDERPRPS